MSAVEALAEVLREHLGGTCSICDDDQPSHLAADLAAAIRSMPAEQVAELIGGTVQTRLSSRYLDSPTYPEWRIATHWHLGTPPLGVSPETNGEQK